ncbi:S1 RNA-binding domain-containing protein [Bacillus infantis]|uniref:S1 RNA-binding domain-containing protein n=1 Tax=Bacillus infantis TaxID=324767 RepID=UPI002002CF28|nr:S1 RNA-binding domain-containing protein [Bacillus infantis]MCK6207732.1 S1 RNA-binding domain-containing protein [Bacillus infantis]
MIESFENPKTIVNNYNEGIKALKDAQVFEKVDHDKFVINKRHAANCLFNSIEWTFLNNLTNTDSRLLLHHRQNNGGSNPSTNQLINFMRREGSPLLTTSSLRINSSIISRYRKDNRNLPEHEGREPYFLELVLVAQEARKIVKAYIGEEFGALNEILTNNQMDILEINNFVDFCANFNADEYLILVSGHTQEKKLENIKVLGKLPWRMVIDFDYDSDVNGLLSQIDNQDLVYPIRPRNLENTFINYRQQKTYWYIANGRASSAPRDIQYIPSIWVMEQEDNIRALVSKVSRQVDVPIKVIITHDEFEHANEIIKRFISICGTSKVSILVLSDNVRFMSEIKTRYNSLSNVSYIPLSFDYLAEGLNYYGFGLEEEKQEDRYFKIPDKQLPYKTLSETDLLDIQQYFEVVHFDIADYEDEDEIDRTLFFRGQQISWQGLKRGDTFETAKFWEFKSELDKTINNKNINDDTTGIRSTLYILRHPSGFGGTTFARNLAWALRTEVPTMILKKYEEQRTKEKVIQLYDLTNKPVLIFADTGQIAFNKILDFYYSLQGKDSRPSILVIVQRNEYNKTNLGRHFEIGYLNKDDRNKLQKHYQRILDNCRYPEDIHKAKAAEINKIFANASGKDYRVKAESPITPFNLGLHIFEENYIGVENFVRRTLANENLSEEQIKILTFLAFIKEYVGDTGLSTEFMNGMVQDVEIKNQADFLNYMPVSFHSLIIFSKEGGPKWQIQHYVIAKEIKKQLLSKDYSGTNWQESLSHYILSFIDNTRICNFKNNGTTNSMKEILQRLLIDRSDDDSTSYNDDFAKIISDLPSDIARENIFKYLVELYPEEPHFHAHLARHYSKKGAYELAIEHIQTAITICEQSGKNVDTTLYNIRAICYKEELEKQFKKLCEKKEAKLPLPQNYLEELIDLEKLASNDFEKCRNLQYSSYGYVPHIRMLINIIDNGFKLSNYESMPQFIKNLNNDWYAQCLNTAEELLKESKLNKLYENDKYLTVVENQLAYKIYEDFDSVFSYWNKLLLDPSKASLAREGLVNTYYRKNKGYENMDQKTLNKVLDHLEENIKEDFADPRSIAYWFMAARHSSDISVAKAFEKVTSWDNLHRTVESSYYKYVLHVLKAINENSSVDFIQAAKDIISSSQRSDNRSNKLYVQDWIGNGKGLKQLIPDKVVREGTKDDRKWLIGEIKNIKESRIGFIDYNGLEVFFKPSLTNEGIGRAFTSDDIGKEVYFYCGFSYEQLRAESRKVYLKKDFEKALAYWEDKVQNQEVIEIGKIIDAKLKHHNPVGFIFAKLPDGSDGSIHVSEIADRYISDLANEYEKNETVRVKIIGFDNKRRTWNLSLKQAMYYNETSN